MPYSGPLSPQLVRLLLQTPISRAARLSVLTTRLAGLQDGHIRHFHFLDSPALPTNQGRASTNGGRAMDQWQCRVCTKLLKVPAENSSNLGVHLYGAGQRTGCLERSHVVSKEDVSPPTYKGGVVVPMGATNSNCRQMALPSCYFGDEPMCAARPLQITTTVDSG
ncbi:hypothetical protein V8E36_005551, partial [Tilletia maclaganii]